MVRSTHPIPNPGGPGAYIGNQNIKSDKQKKKTEMEMKERDLASYREVELGVSHGHVGASWGSRTRPRRRCLRAFPNSKWRTRGSDGKTKIKTVGYFGFGSLIFNGAPKYADGFYSNPIPVLFFIILVNILFKFRYSPLII